MPTTLSGTVALITGASRGIGAAIAQRLARDGAAVAITYATAPQKAGQTRSPPSSPALPVPKWASSPAPA